MFAHARLASLFHFFRCFISFEMMIMTLEGSQRHVRVLFAQVYSSVKSTIPQSGSTTSESVNFGIDSPECTSALFVCAVRMCVKSMKESSSFRLAFWRVVYYILWIDSKSCFLSWKEKQPRQAIVVRVIFLFLYTFLVCWCCLNAHPVDQLACHAPIGDVNPPPSYVDRLFLSCGGLPSPADWLFSQRNGKLLSRHQIGIFISTFSLRSFCSVTCQILVYY